jgi:hypothetical protein
MTGKKYYVVHWHVIRRSRIEFTVFALGEKSRIRLLSAFLQVIFLGSGVKLVFSAFVPLYLDFHI